MIWRRPPEDSDLPVCDAWRHNADALSRPVREPQNCVGLAWLQFTGGGFAKAGLRGCAAGAFV